MRSRTLIAVLATTVAAGCTGGSPPPPSPPPPQPRAPAIYRTAIEDFGFTDGFDPVGEYSKLAWGLYSQLLLRTLITFRHVAGDAGREPVPDIATDTGEVSPDGLTWTFHLKRGIRFGPPVDRAVTSRDIEYAFRRIDSASLRQPNNIYGLTDYAFYYDGVIVGMDGPRTRMPADISGIDSSDPRVIVFHLRHPAGDFPMRLALPATAPVPHEIAGCFKQPERYGRALIATGPYMVRGENRLHLPCSRLRVSANFYPRGHHPVDRMELLRNPNYDSATDDPSIRENNLDGVDISIDTNTVDIFRGVVDGRYDGSIASIPAPDMLDDLKARGVVVHSDPVDRLWYLVLNLLWPPFDDVHVRRAVSNLVDRERMLNLLGGLEWGRAASGILPPDAHEPRAPDLAAARAEMRRSRYNENPDARCGPSRSCRVFTVAPTTPPRTLWIREVDDELRPLGIDLAPREIDSLGYLEPDEPTFITNTGMIDYPDPFAVASLLSRSGTCPARRNFAQVGITRRRAAACRGSVQQAVQDRGPPPSLDEDISRCERLPMGADRATCWQGFQRTVERLSPWVPLVWANALTVTNRTVAHYEFDQFSGMISLAHIVLPR